MGARRLADPRLALAVGAHRHGRRAQPPAGDQPLQDLRQPEAQPARARLRRLARGLLHAVPAERVALGRRRASDPGVSRAADAGGGAARTGRGAAARLPARPGRPRAHGARARAGAPDVPRLSRGRDAPRHPAHARSHAAHAAPAAGVGDRGRGRRARHGARQRRRPAYVPGRDGREPGARPRARAADRQAAAGRPAGCGPAARALGGGSPARLPAEPAGARERDGRARRGGPRPVPSRGEAQLELLRRVRGARGSLASARQLPGAARADAGAPQLADQHRHGAALDARRARPRLHGHDGDGHAPRADARHARPPGAPPGPPAQLVRHAHARAAAAPLRVHRRQRQPGRLHDVAGPGAARARRRPRAPPALGGARRHRRAAHPGPGHGAGPAAAAGRAARAPAAPRRRAARGGGRRGRAAQARAARERRGRAAPTLPQRPARVGRGPRDRPPDGGPRRQHRVAARRRGERRERDGPGPGSAARSARRARRGVGRGDGLPLPFRRPAQAVRDRLPARRRRGAGTPRHGDVRPARLGGPARELHRDRQGGRAAGALVPAGPALHQRRRRARAPVVERHDVRVPDAAAADAQLSGDAARPVLRAGPAAPDAVRGEPGRAVGHLRVGLRGRRSARSLPVQGLRRPGAGAEARARRRAGDRPLRRGARRARRAVPRGAQPAAARRPGAARAPRLLRGRRLHAPQERVARCRRSTRGLARRCAPTSRTTRA